MKAVLRAIVAFVVAGLAAGLLAPLPATAAPYATVSGVITGPGGRELAGVQHVRVYLLRKVGRQWKEVRSSLVDAPARWTYELRVGKPGTYLVSARPKGGAYAPTKSKALRVRAGNTTANIALKRSGAVAGSVVGIPAGTRRGTVTLWRRTKQAWVKANALRLSDEHTYVFGTKPGRYRVTYHNASATIWAPASKPVVVKGKARVRAADHVVRRSKTISGTLTRVGFTWQVFLHAEVYSAGRWKDLPLFNRVPGDTFSVPVPGARPKVRLRVRGNPEETPTIYWNGTTRGTTYASRAKTIDLTRSLTGIDFTVPLLREFTTVTPPRIVGSLRVGSTLRVTDGWSPEPKRIRYQWMRSPGGYALKNTGRTYELKKADRGRKIWVVVRIDRPWYRAQQVTTASVRIPKK